MTLRIVASLFSYPVSFAQNGIPQTAENEALSIARS